MWTSTQRLDVVEVTPREHVDAPDAGRRGQVADLGEGIGVLRHGVAHRWSSPGLLPGRSTVTAAGCGSATGNRCMLRTSAPAHQRLGVRTTRRSSPCPAPTTPMRPSLTEALADVDGWFSPEQVDRVVERVAGAADRPDRRDRQLPGPVDDRHRPLGPGGRRDRGHRPTRATTGARRRSRASRTRPPSTARCSSPTSSGPGCVTGSPTSASSATRPSATSRAHRPAAHRRCPPLRPGERRHPELGCPGRTRRIDADPRLVLLGRGHAALAPPWRSPGLARGRSRSLAEYRREPVRGSARSPTSGASWPSSRGSSATSPSRRCSSRSSLRGAALGHDGSTWLHY